MIALNADQVLLQECLKAFEAMGTASQARKMLKRMGQQPEAYAGEGKSILASFMAKKIRDHLGVEDA